MHRAGDYNVAYLTNPGITRKAFMASMMATQALYLSTNQLYCEAELLACFQEDGQWIAVLDKTVFHPQDEGQPGDTGRILTHCGERAQVLHTRKVGDEIQHILDHPLPTGMTTMALDKEARQLHSCLHSLGHLIGTIGLQNGWQPIRANHWPNTCHVEFAPKTHVVELDEQTIAQHLSRLIAAGLPVQISLDQTGTRRVGFGDLSALPCVGTHISNTRELPANIRISTRLQQGNLQVRYHIPEAA
ncbi:hypothetical protein [Photobacterium galatheae]|uniref:Threonyl/alanyl tRNA synthetase SAD domain-containing protein n=1 Tax=Photobacterium galatheae TaxID=1654360 RepID=A0A066RR72_9GAMM|nr:hypothetical protein [Photobacterium galatheae]KDM92859.1 hypothetical protein EA58_03625 [Photobacterium galatheae]MCM0148176.1 hypothetical protein [Photobacterium galatheae]